MVCAMPKIIGFCGVAGVGKTTAAEYLIKHHGYAACNIADEIRRVLIESFNIPREYLYERKEEIIPGYNSSGRKMLQHLGFEFGRQLLYSEVWLDLWKSNVQHEDKVVVGDVRFPNEADAVLAMGGLLVRITGRDTCTVETAHISEVQLPDSYFPARITNEGTLEQLYAKLDVLMNYLHIVEDWSTLYPPELT